MKSLLMIALTMTSLQAFAFTSVTLKGAAVLTKTNTDSSLRFSATESTGSDYCIIAIRSDSSEETVSVAAGTVFEVTSLDQNGCGRDWGRQCRLDLSTRNQEKGLTLSLLCKDKGALAQELTVAEVNKIAKKIISVK